MPNRTLALMWLALLVVAGCASPAQMVGPRTQVPTVEPGMARVWFFRQSDNLTASVIGNS